MKLLRRILEVFALGYRFTDGARLLSDGRDSMIFVSVDGRRVSAYCELWRDDNGYQRCIYRNSIKEWMPPHEYQAFSESDREEVIARIAQFYNKTKTKYLVK